MNQENKLLVKKKKKKKKKKKMLELRKKTNIYFFSAKIIQTWKKYEKINTRDICPNRINHLIIIIFLRLKSPNNWVFCLEFDKKGIF